jgi:hypothetical protein
MAEQIAETFQTQAEVLCKDTKADLVVFLDHNGQTIVQKGNDDLKKTLMQTEGLATALKEDRSGFSTPTSYFLLSSNRVLVAVAFGPKTSSNLVKLHTRKAAIKLAPLIEELEGMGSGLPEFTDDDLDALGEI